MSRLTRVFKIAMRKNNVGRVVEQRCVFGGVDCGYKMGFSCSCAR